MKTNISRCLVIVALAVTVFAADALASQRKPVPFLNGGRGVRTLEPNEALRSRPQGPAQSRVPVQGIVRSGRGDTIRIGRTVVRLTDRTAIQSFVGRHDDATYRPDVLAGRTVTVYGTPVHGGKMVEATMVIVRPEPHEILLRAAKLPKGSDESRYTVPGTSPDCGTLLPSAPE